MRCILAPLLIVMQLTGCTCVVGFESDTYQAGINWTALKNGEKGCVIHRWIPGLDIRINTGDSGFSFGFASRTMAQPYQFNKVNQSPEVILGLGPYAFPLGVTWNSGGTFHSLGIVILKYPQFNTSRVGGVDPPLLFAVQGLHLDAELSTVRQGISINLEQRVHLVADPYASRLYTVRFESSNPTDTIFTMEE